MDRREFLKKTLVAGVGALVLGGCKGRAGDTAAGPANLPPVASAAGAASSGKVGKNRWQSGPVNGVDLAVARGAKGADLVAGALGVFGGMSAFVKAGDRVLIKPNLAWGRTPEQAAGTSPEVLLAVIKACQDAGAGEVIVGEHTIDSSAVTFDMSGASRVCKEAGVPLVSYDKEQLYKEIQVAGVNIKDDLVPLDILECDVYINLPILKHHAATELTMALKNQMGAVWDRQKYHRTQGSSGANNLHQNIADLGTALRPTLNILDAMRVLKTGGPKGPGLVEELGVVCASPNICAVDAYGAKLMGKTAEQIPHIGMASKAGLGECDLQKLVVKEA